MFDTYACRLFVVFGAVCDVIYCSIYAQMQVQKNKWVGGSLVAHALEVYTPNVLNLFKELKDKSESYFTYELVPGDEYMVEHYDLARIQRWWNGRYKVRVCAGKHMQ